MVDIPNRINNPKAERRIAISLNTGGCFFPSQVKRKTIGRLYKNNVITSIVICPWVLIKDIRAIEEIKKIAKIVLRMALIERGCL